jgi:hypothetical protein
VKTLDQATNVRSGVDKTEGGAETDFAYYVVGEVDCLKMFALAASLGMRFGDVYPRREVELSGSLAEKLIELGEPVVNSLIYEGFHPLDVTECIWTCGNFAEMRMHFVFPHVE